MSDNNDKVMRSPRDAAIGVATLSGLMPSFLEQTMTKIITTPVTHDASVRLETYARD